MYRLLVAACFPLVVHAAKPVDVDELEKLAKSWEQQAQDVMITGLSKMTPEQRAIDLINRATLMHQHAQELRAKIDRPRHQRQGKPFKDPAAR